MKILGRDVTFADLASIRSLGNLVADFGLLGVGMGLGLSLTGFSLFKGLLAASNTFLAVGALLFALILLIILSGAVASLLTGGRYFRGFLLGIPLLAFVGLISFFSFTYWYEVVGARGDWFAPEARRTVEAFEQFNRNVATAVQNEEEEALLNFQAEPGVSGLRTRMISIQDRFSNLAATAGQGTSLDKALEAATSNSLAKELAAQTPLAGEISSLETEISNLGIAIASTKERIERSGAGDVVLVDFRKRLNTALDYEHRDRATITSIGDEEFITEPDYARELLAKFDEEFSNLQVKLDVCGGAPLTQEQKDNGKKPRQRVFGSGGSCSIELDRLIVVIDERRKELSDQKDELLKQEGEINQLESRRDSKNAELVQANNRIAKLHERQQNPSHKKVDLAQEVESFWIDPTQALLDVVQVNCASLAEIASGIEALKADGPLDCSINGVAGSLQAFSARKGELAKVRETCLASDNADIIRVHARSIISGISGTELRTKLLAALQGLNTEIFQPCAALAEQQAVPIADIRAGADEYLANKGSQDALSAAIERFRTIITGRGTGAQNALFLFVILLELLYFILKIFRNVKERKRLQESGVEGNIQPHVAEAIVRYAAGADKGPGYTVPMNKIERLEPTLQYEVAMALEDLVALGYTKRLRKRSGYWLSDAGRSKLREMLQDGAITNESKAAQGADESVDAHEEEFKKRRKTQDPIAQKLSGAFARETRRAGPSGFAEPPVEPFSGAIPGQETYAQGEQSARWKKSFTIHKEIRDLNLNSGK